MTEVQGLSAAVSGKSPPLRVFRLSGEVALSLVVALVGVVVMVQSGQGVLHDRFILFLDMPLTIILTLAMIVGVFRRRMSRAFGLVLLCTYAAWVIVHLWIQ